ncbi:MAG: TlpA family protein disulfide reductase [Anaerolineales bacterium]|nr:TlpA family protein disulfide reductase [Anaerolineales bacterium]
MVAALSALALLTLVGIRLWAVNLGPAASGPAPDFPLTTFEGQTIHLADFRGKVVVLNIWASWCVPCRDEAPVLEAIWREYKDRGVVFIGVDYADTEREARAFIAEFGVTYPNGPDLGTRIYTQYRARGVPETYFVGKDGRLHDPYIGPLTETELRTRLEALTQEP